jgi:predicted MPP superfamily phosphohydrolase
VSNKTSPRRRRWSPGRRPTFIVVLLALPVALFWVPWAALFPEAAQWPWPVRPLGTALFAVATVAMPALLVLGRRRHSDRAARTGHWLLGVSWLLFSWTVLTEVPRLVLALAGVDDPARSRIIAGLLIVIVLILLGYGSYEARRVPRVKRGEVMIPRLAPAFDGLIIAVVSDTHYGPIERAGWSRDLVKAVNGLNADVVVHAGDLADGTVEQRARQVAPLGDVRAPARFYISGNHEYLVSAQRWFDHMAGLGWTVLHNEHRVLELGGARLVFAGVDDATAAASGEPGHAADLASALTGIQPDDPVVLLAHQPGQVAAAVAAGVDLQLSGHTHGGQIWPFHLVVRPQQRTLAGLTRHGARTQLYTSRGAGFWGPPLRVFAPSEISLLTLRSGPR